MTYLRVLVITCLILLPQLGFSTDSNYGYPIPGSYEATIIGTPATLMPELPVKIRSRQLVLKILPNRPKPPIFFYDEGLYCTLAYQKKKAPLVFLISGAGSNDRAAKLLAMTKALYQAGFHVITLPSTSHANFIVSASQSSIPGDLVEDAVDLYRAMEMAWNEVRNEIEVSSFHLGGYSLGATQAAFVAKLDEERVFLSLFSKKASRTYQAGADRFSGAEKHRRVSEIVRKIWCDDQRE